MELQLFLVHHFESESESCSVVSDSLWPMDYTVHGILQARILEWVAFSFSRGSSQPRDWTRSPTLQADSLQGQKISFQKSLLPTSPFLFMTDHPLNNAYVYLYCSKLSSFKPSVLSLSSELLYVLDFEFPTYPVKKSHFQESSTVNALINNLSY